ncbi:MAG: patatin-like phospholipase family protein [Bacteroidota bacterium]
MITNNVAPNYGVAYLFLGPEYINQISFISYLIVGFSCGGFIMAYNIASFIKNAYRFPFLASLRYPFMKYCLNNFTFPLVFLTTYCFQIYFFLKGEEIMSAAQIILMIGAFLGGVAFFLFLALTYFFKVNKDIFKLYGIQHKIDKPDKLVKSVITGERNPRLIKESRDWYVETYFSTPTSVRLVRSVQHYKKEMLKDVIRQNHHVAFIFQMFTIFSLLALGILGEINAFEIPAGASILLLLTMFIMLYSSFYRWWGGWSVPVFILFLMVFNYLHKYDILSVDHAFGMNYNTVKADYSYNNIKKMDNQHELFDLDVKKTIDILNKWKAKNTSLAHPEQKPKLVFINTSGGGLRSALWTFYTLQYADSLMHGKLLAQTQLITGSSGGMIGAAYLRELYLQKQKKEIRSYYYRKYLTNISNDILNPIAFKIATSEWLMPLQSFTIDGNVCPKDRAYAFEHRLHENTENAFNKRLSDYKLSEANSLIPMMVFSPSIVNDGRKLIISPQGVSYLTQNVRTLRTTYNKLYDAIEYSRFFEQQDASETMFSSVLRMSATFPYISPVVSMPSEPRIEIMDAGLRDNFGLETTLRFIKTFNDWIAENTSGVVIIQIRDKHKNGPIEDNPAQTLMESLGRPMGSVYGNLFDVQDYNHNQQIQVADYWCKSKIEFVDLQLRNEKNDHISLSWHLTNKEKKKVFKSISLPENVAAIRRIEELLK